MAILISEDFVGAALTSVVGRTPPVGFAGLTWDGDGFGPYSELDGSGYARAPNQSAADSASIAIYGVTGTDYGNPRDTKITFTMRTGASVGLSGTLSHRGITITCVTGGLTISFRVWGYYSGGVMAWYANINGGDAFVIVTPEITPNTDYIGAIEIHDGAQTFTFLGNVLTTAKPYTDTLGLQRVKIDVGGFSRLDTLLVESAAAAPSDFLVYAAAASPMGAARVLSVQGLAAMDCLAYAAAPSPMAAVRALVLHDFSGLLGDANSVYVMDLITPGGAVRVPVSSWQATLQTDSSNYVQCVVPACSQWVDTLNVATEFVIYRQALLPNGDTFAYEMVRAPAEQLRFDQGPERHTCTLSGYSTAFAANANPPAAYDRALVGIRSVSSGGGGTRVRCAVDWLLRPGHRAFVSGVPMLVSYINYYAPTGFDAYMDVGSRA